MSLDNTIQGVAAMLILSNFVFLVGYGIYHTHRGAIGCIAATFAVIGLHSIEPSVFGREYLWAIIWALSFGMMYLLRKPPHAEADGGNTTVL